MEPISHPNSPSVEAAQPVHTESAEPSSLAANGAQERVSTVEQGSQSSAMPVPIAAMPAPQQGQLPAVQQGQTQVVQDDDAPLVAADDEVMEKEWVDKAKKIVTETKDDPFNQEKAVSKLQADYIKKRYGKEIKLTSD